MNRNLSLTRFWILEFPFYILPRACTALWIGWVTHQPRSLLISLTDLDLDQRPPRYGCPTICIQDSIKATSPVWATVHTGTRFFWPQLCHPILQMAYLSLSLYLFCLFPLPLSLSLSQDTSSQVTGFQLALERSTRQKKANSDSTSTTSQDPLVKEISGKNGTHMVPSASLLCERVEWINRSSGRTGPSPQTTEQTTFWQITPTW